jgi:hypothetical protein
MKISMTVPQFHVAPSEPALMVWTHTRVPAMLDTLVQFVKLISMTVLQFRVAPTEPALMVWTHTRVSVTMATSVKLAVLQK